MRIRPDPDSDHWSQHWLYILYVTQADQNQQQRLQLHQQTWLKGKQEYYYLLYIQAVHTILKSQALYTNGQGLLDLKYD